MATQPQPAGPAVTPATVLEAALGALRPVSVRMYRSAWARFAARLGLPTAADALGLLGRTEPRTAHAWAAEHWAGLVASGLSRSTVSVHLTALRTVATAAYRAGVLGYVLDVPRARGPGWQPRSVPLGRDDVARVLAALDPRSPRGVRDRALVLLVASAGCRRGELAATDLSDFDATKGSLTLRRPTRRSGAEVVTLPDAAADALRAWVAVHPGESDAMFVSVDRGSATRATGRRLHPDSLWRTLKELGDAAGVKLDSRRLLATGVQRAAAATGGSAYAVQAFTRATTLEGAQVWAGALHHQRADVARRVAASLT